MPKTYQVSGRGRSRLRSIVASYKPEIPPVSPLVEEGMPIPIAISVLEDFAEGDYPVTLPAIREKWGSEGVRAFEVLHRAGYFVEDQ